LRCCCLQNCVDRYTAFRNYVLSLKDSGATDVSLAAAAADFTKQQKRYARAAARGGGLGALAAAAAAPAVGPAGTAGARSGRQQPAEGWVRELEGVDNSYAALIQQTKERMQQKRQQQQETQQDQETQQTEQQQGQQLADGNRQPLRPSQEQQHQQPRLLETLLQQQEWQGSNIEQHVAAQAQAVCGVQRQGSGSQVAAADGTAGKQAAPQQCKVAELQLQQQQQQIYPGVVVVPESDEEL
jgi:hypothetical protein